MIFKSRQVNLDPKPYKAIYEDSSYGPIHTGRFEFKPSPEFEPTRDPLPWYDPSEIEAGDNGRWPDSERVRNCYASEYGLMWAPRREQFDTPVNPILVDCRDYWKHVPKITAREVGIYLEVCYLEGFLVDGSATIEHVKHARRVLPRLANL